MPHETAVDALLADPRLQAVFEDFAARIRTGRPVRWHRLMHETLGIQLHASPDLALVTAMHWRLFRAGIATHIVSGWLETTPA
jgi:hypothetical protein